MENRDKNTEKLLKELSIEYKNENFLYVFKAADEAFKKNPYDPLIYMYRAFSHMWYSFLEDDSLYEQDIVTDMSICLDIGFENGENAEYYEIVRFCFCEYTGYMLYLIRRIIAEANEKKEELSATYDIEELNDGVNNIISEIGIPFEDTIESFWDLGILSKIKNINKCPEDIFSSIINFIDEYRDLTGRYPFYDYDDKFNEIYTIKTEHKQNVLTPEILESDAALYKKRISRWKRHLFLLNTAVSGKIQQLENDISSLKSKKSGLGFFNFSKKKELDIQITALQHEINRYINNKDFEIEIINKMLQKYENYLNNQDS